MVVGPFPQGFPQDRHVPGESPLLNDRFTPYQIEQFVLGKHVSLVPNERKKRVQYFRRQRNVVAIALQESPLGIEREGAEFVEVVSLLAHSRAGRIEKKNEGRS